MTILNIFTDPLNRVTWFSLLNIIVWTTVIYFIVRRIKRKRNSTTMLMVLALLTLGSCKKEHTALSVQPEQPLHFSSTHEADEWLAKATAERTFTTPKSPFLDSSMKISSYLEKNIGAAPRDPDPAPSGTAMLVEVFLFSGHSVGFQWSILGMDGSGVSAVRRTNGIEHGNGYWMIANLLCDVIGVTPGVTFKQTQVTWRNYPNSYLVYFEVQGIESYAIFTNGIGVYNSYPMVITGTYNINTRTYTLSSRSTKPAITP